MPFANKYGNESNNYYNENETPLNGIEGLLSVIGIAAAGVAGYKSGMAAPVIKSIIKGIGQYKGTKLSSMSQALKTWEDAAGGLNNSIFRSGIINNIKNLKNTETRNALINETRKDLDNFKSFMDSANKKAAEAQRKGIAMSSVDKDTHWLYSDPEFVENYKAIGDIRRRLINKGWNEKDIKPVTTKMHDELISKFSISSKQQSDMMKRTGHRLLTLGDLNKTNIRELLDENSAKKFQAQLESMVEFSKKSDKYKNLYVDRNLMIDDTGKISDTRAFMNSLRKSSETMAEEFHIPFININPMKLFYTGRFIERPKPAFAILEQGTVQPGVTGTIDKIGEELFYIKGNVFKASNFNDPVAVGVHLEDINAARNVATRYYRSMAGISLKEFEDVNQQDKVRSYWSKLLKLVDVGFQDVKAPDFNLANPMTYTSIIDKMLKGPLKPHGGVVESKLLEEAFGKSSGYIAMKDSVKLRDAIDPNVGPSLTDYIGQFFKGRNSLKEVTPMTLVPYAFMERLNVGLSAAGLGLSVQHTGSAKDVYVNLLTRRIFPVMAGISAWNYMNYEAENMFGTNPEEALADAYVNARINFAGLNDFLGLTDIGKKVKELTPGSEQISDIPGLGIFDISKSAEDMYKYYTEGEDAIRKGRYWPLGNTPFTGMKTEYFRPNWYRRLKSDWKMSDSLYGSEDEYWANHWLPSLRYPLSPIRHFITNNRWLEEKHYYDRPYPVSEGINEIKGIPIFGSFLNATVGELLKPTKKMHEEYWDGDQLIDPRIGRKTEEEVGGETLVYTTSGGSPQVVQTPSDAKVNIRNINEAIKGQSLGKTIAGTRNKYIRPDTPEVIREQPPIHDIGNETMIDITELGGIYGFSFASVAPGDPEWRPELATPDDIANWSDDFWEAGLGGIGGDISEIYRRFIPRDKNKTREINPIRNTMPDWIPGEEYFLDLQHGDPYRIAYGEIRLPGEAYERIHGIHSPMELGIGSSFLGKSKEQMVKYFFQEDDLMSDTLQDIVKKGTKLHEQIEKDFGQAGFLIDSEITVYNPEHNWTGTYDARVIDRSSIAGESVLDIKSVSNKKYKMLAEGREAFEENVGQVNAYMHQLRLPKGYLYYVNRDDPDAKPIIREIEYDAEKYNEQMETLESARQEVRDLINSGVKQRGDLYNHIERFKILADVAPYSDEYRKAKDELSMLQLNEEQKKEIAETRRQVTEQKKKVRTYDYKFATANLEYETVTITKVLDNNTFMTAEHPDNPIKLAGVRVSTAKDNPEALAAAEFISKYISVGEKVQIGYDSDEANMIASDTYKTIRSVVNAGFANNVNINKELLDKGLAKQNETDDSPAGIRAKYSSFQIALGTMWEKFVHLDTFVHTKMLQVRSPLEQYSRREVYGKDFQDWASPIQDYLIPTIQSLGNRSIPVATGMGAIIGMMFGRKLYGKVLGTSIGGLTGLGISSYAASYKILDDTWIPERRVRERDINEYVDILKFLKYKKLYMDYAELAKEKEGFNVGAYLTGKGKSGEERKARKAELEDIKRALYRDDIDYDEALDIANISGDASDYREAMKLINAEINKISEFREVEKLGPLAAKAIAYYNQSESTMYGYDPGESIANIMGALPKKDRQYFQEFLNAPEEEKERILEVVPSYMKRPLQAAWGMIPDEKPDLNEYFKTHNLPAPTWEGWTEESNFDMVRVKIIQHEAIASTEFNVWPEQIEQAAMESAPAPIMEASNSEREIRQKLLDLLHGEEIDDIDIQIRKNTTGRTNIETEIIEDPRWTIESSIRDYGSSIY